MNKQTRAGDEIVRVRVCMGAGGNVRGVSVSEKVLPARATRRILYRDTLPTLALLSFPLSFPIVSLSLSFSFRLPRSIFDFDQAAMAL